MSLYNIHKDRQIEEQDLHWGEEIEYHLYTFDENNQKVRLACDADEIMTKFAEYMDLLESFKTDDGNAESQDIELFGFDQEDRKDNKPDFKLLPEFGNFMIEAVPLDPYGAYSDPDQLLKCQERIKFRRDFMTKFLKANGNATLISTSASPILGMTDCCISQNAEFQAQIDKAKS